MILFFVFRLDTFKSKVSNLLLTLGAKGAVGFKSYPTSEIPSKYIYDAYNDLFTYFVAVFFVVVVVFTFCHFRGSSRRSTKAVIL